MGESIFDAAVREVHEETGLQVHPVYFQDNHKFTQSYPDPRKGLQSHLSPVFTVTESISRDLMSGSIDYHFVLHHVVCVVEKADMGKAKALTDAADLKWIPRECVKDSVSTNPSTSTLTMKGETLPLVPDMAEVIDQVITACET